MSDLIGGNSSPQPASGANGAGLIKDSSVETFMADVIEASTKMPVIVDFWAEWCGPCRTLGPLLEAAIIARNGKLAMVKVDIDKNQMLAQQLRIQSVPTVMAFINGQPVDGFAGALPESEINAFLDRVEAAAAHAGVAGNAGGIDLKAAIEAAEKAFDDGDMAQAGSLFGQIAEQASDDEAIRMRALAGLGKCYLQMDEIEQAKAVLDTIPEGKRAEPAIAGAFAALALAQSKPDDSALQALEKAAQAAPDDMQAQFDYAEALMGAKDMERASDILLTLIEKDREWEDGKAKEKLLTLFEALGPKDPLTLKVRRRLSSILFS
jgi:putative thioredoxin